MQIVECYAVFGTSRDRITLISDALLAYSAPGPKHKCTSTAIGITPIGPAYLENL